MICYFCKQNSANTLEHLIPKGLKGREQARILCHICNNKFGRDLDKGLISFFSSKDVVINNLVLRGILKIAINFCIANKVFVEEGVGLLLSNCLLDNYVRQIEYIPRKNEVSHSLILYGELGGRIYAIITIYNRSFLVDLGFNDKRERIFKNYCYSFTRRKKCCKKYYKDLDVEKILFQNV
jgi:hypothetical protein